MAAPVAPAEFFASVPAPPLDRFVEAVWAVRGSAGYRRAAVLPNGAIQLMLNFGAPHAVTAFGDRSAEIEFAGAWLAGLQGRRPAAEDLARVQRFHDALRRLPAAPARADLALELGYADQAHFNHEFRRFAGVTPGEFVLRRGDDGESLVLG